MWYVNAVFEYEGFEGGLCLNVDASTAEEAIEKFKTVFNKSELPLRITDVEELE